MAEVLDENTTMEDPFHTVPIGWHCPINKYKVVGFCGPAGKKIISLMVYVLYDGRPPAHLYSTTRDYLAVVSDYKKWADSLPAKERLRAYGHDEKVIELLFKNT